jgi:hypothetical protein
VVAAAGAVVGFAAAAAAAGAVVAAGAAAADVAAGAAGADAGALLGAAVELHASPANSKSEKPTPRTGLVAAETGLRYMQLTPLGPCLVSLKTSPRARA